MRYKKNSWAKDNFIKPKKLICCGKYVQEMRRPGLWRANMMPKTHSAGVEHGYILIFKGIGAMRRALRQRKWLQIGRGEGSEHKTQTINYF